MQTAVNMVPVKMAADSCDRLVIPEVLVSSLVDILIAIEINPEGMPLVDSQTSAMINQVFDGTNTIKNAGH